MPPSTILSGSGAPHPNKPRVPPTSNLPQMPKCNPTPPTALRHPTRWRCPPRRRPHARRRTGGRLRRPGLSTTTKNKTDIATRRSSSPITATRIRFCNRHITCTVAPGETASASEHPCHRCITRLGKQKCAGTFESLSQRSHSASPTCTSGPKRPAGDQLWYVDVRHPARATQQPRSAGVVGW